MVLRILEYETLPSTLLSYQLLPQATPPAAGAIENLKMHVSEKGAKWLLLGSRLGGIIWGKRSLGG